jgi:hypothetical protein
MAHERYTSSGWQRIDSSQDEMSEDEDRERAGDALRKQLVRDVDALAEAGPEPIPVERVCTDEEDARGIVDPLKAKR